MTLPVDENAGIVKNGGNSSTMRVCSRMLPPPSQQVTSRCHHCTKTMAKLCRRRCIGRVNATCDEFDNQLYVLTTSYGWKPVYWLSGLLFDIPSICSTACRQLVTHTFSSVYVYIPRVAIETSGGSHPHSPHPVALPLTINTFCFIFKITLAFVMVTNRDMLQNRHDIL